ncbi:hybrid sensor histidine kinase/response regulator [Prosthecobacter dejongeii]|uniref:Two-component system probable response regulator PhcQ n=1 Tax=Prosthecobacter dejongeii TaxID=48465 RepID=A0A7W8DRN5_9BACT|nr:hybrid sensor histidine kinase/response regulator [Prosthecobacter dejongeii]MBB5040069.1 two-component system probable response regulator PhcQ [Prosthecobacter dejongeii]
MNPPPLANYHVLYVDDEEKALHYFRQMFEDEFIIHTASNAADGYRILENYGPQIGVLLTDQRMPGESGVELMDRARRLHPNLVRILVTAFTDYQTAVKAVNEGRAYRYLHKPLDPEQLAAVLRQGMEYYETLQEREGLLTQNAENIRTTLMADRVAGMGIMAEGLNHHLRNALTVVRAFIDLAPMKLMEEIDARPPRDPNFWVETQHQAQAQIERIQTLLNHLAHASHARKLNRQDTVSLPALLEETLNTYIGHFQEKNIRVEFDISPTLPPLLVHEERFRQLWRLLFIEEITHLHPGDRVVVRARMERDASGQEQAVMVLTDNGGWGAQDRAANLFDPFFTRSRKPDDFGVNMMACYVTLHLHGGSIEAKRLEPQGLELTMRLPLDPNQSTQEANDFFLHATQHEQRWQKREELAA